MRFFGFLLLITSSASLAMGQNNALERRRLSLNECVQLALHHNLEVKIKRYNPEISRYNLQAQYGAYDPNLSMSGGHDHSLIAGGVDQQGRSYAGTQTDANRVGTSFDGILPWGLSYGLGANFTDTYGTRPGAVPDFTQPVIVTNTFFDFTHQENVTFFSTNYATTPTRVPFDNVSGRVGFMELRQPLLKNFWIDSIRLQIYLSKKNLESAELDLRQQLMTTLTAVESAYYELVFSEEQVLVQKKSLEMAEQQLSNDKRRVEVGALAPLGEKLSESQVASSRVSVTSAIADRDTRQRALKILLSDNYDNWKNVYIETTDKLLAIPQEFNLQDSWRKGLTLRPDILQQRLALDRQDMTIKYQRNQLYPQLDLVGNYGYSGSSTRVNDSLGQIRDRDNPFWSVGGQLSIPLTRTSARNAYQAGKASREQIELELRQQEQAALVEIENSIAVAQTAFAQIDATRVARQYAEEALDAEQKKLENGKSTTFDVLALQIRLTNARSDEINALRAYNVALARVAFFEGYTLERRRVSLEVR
jgi:HAE1 family hydrophobic/amphiphilic exporter-1